MITLDEKIVGIWFMNPMPGQDWMAAVNEIEPEAKYKLTYRFRYYKDDKAFDSEDKKNWYEGEVTGTRSYVIAAMRHVAQTLAEKSGEAGPVYEVLNDGDVQKFRRTLGDMPFVFMRAEGKI